MNVTSTLVKTVSVIALAFWLTACVQTKPVPGYARSGDIVVLGLGGIHRNSLSETFLTVDDLTITITDSSSATYQLGGLTIFKSYPDYTSPLNINPQNGSGNPLALIAYDGGWFVTVPLTTPGDVNDPLPLAIGPATISVSSPKLANTALVQEGDLSAIPIEIIPGVSAFDNNYAQQFNYYVQSRSAFIVRPNDLMGVTSVGGAYFEIEYSDDSLFNLGVLPVVLPVNHNPYVQISYNVQENGDGSGTVYVTLLNPAGFKSIDTYAPNSSMLADLTLLLQYFPVVGASYPPGTDVPGLYKSTISLNVSKSYYIDTDGVEISGLQPEFIHAADL